MKEIAKFYKAKIPTLKRVKVKSDGQVQTRSLCALALFVLSPHGHAT